MLNEELVDEEEIVNNTTNMETTRGGLNVNDRISTRKKSRPSHAILETRNQVLNLVEKNDNNKIKGWIA